MTRIAAGEEENDESTHVPINGINGTRDGALREPRNHVITRNYCIVNSLRAQLGNLFSWEGSSELGITRLSPETQSGNGKGSNRATKPNQLSESGPTIPNHDPIYYGLFNDRGLSVIGILRDKS